MCRCQTTFSLFLFPNTLRIQIPSRRRFTQTRSLLKDHRWPYCVWHWAIPRQKSHYMLAASKSRVIPHDKWLPPYKMWPPKWTMSLVMQVRTTHSTHSHSIAIDFNFGLKARDGSATNALKLTEMEITIFTFSLPLAVLVQIMDSAYRCSCRRKFKSDVSWWRSYFIIWCSGCRESRFDSRFQMEMQLCNSFCLSNPG